MSAGRLEQVGVPVDIYRHPVRASPLEFMGTTNVLPGIVWRARGGAWCASVSVPLSYLWRITGACKGEPVCLCLRPEALKHRACRRCQALAGLARLEVMVTRTEIIGPLARLDDACRTAARSGGAARRSRCATRARQTYRCLAYDPTRLTVFRQGSP